MFEYDVAISFAGPQRPEAEAIADGLQRKSLKVFYDAYEQADLWGKNLYDHLDDVYQNKAQYCLMLVSAAYAARVWTNHERQSAQVRALSQKGEYILPVRFDDTEVPGLRSTVGFVRFKDLGVDGLCTLLVQKVQASKTGPGGGIHPPRDDPHSEIWFREEALLDGEGMTRRGLMYAEGLDGLPKDDSKAVYWFRRVKELGHLHEVVCLGVMYASDRGRRSVDSLLANWDAFSASPRIQFAGGKPVQTVSPKRRVYDGAEKLSAMFGDDWVANFLALIDDPVRVASLSDKQLQDMQYALGFGFLSGAAGECDEASAEKYLHAACGAGHTNAKALLGSLLLDRENERDQRRGYALTTEAAKAGCSSAQLNFVVPFCSIAHWKEGRIVKQDKEESRRFLVAAAESGLAAAQYCLGCELLDLHHNKNEEARVWLEKACAQEYPPAMFKLATLYLLHDQGKNSKEQFVALLRRAADAGVVRAQGMMGIFYEAGAWGFDKDLVQAAAWREKGANSHKGTDGRDFCLDSLAEAYLYGAGVSRDPQKAIELFKEAAEEGSAAAAFALYEFCKEGTYLGKDNEKAIQWCRQAAENGHDRAAELFDAAELCCTTPPDIPRDVSFQWLRRAADQSIRSSTHYRLGLRYWNGDGVDKDEAAAVAWFSFAARDDSNDRSAEAAYALGTAYETGKGVRRRDTASALRWYKRAVELGMPAAKGDVTRMKEAEDSMIGRDTDVERLPVHQSTVNEPRTVGFSSTFLWLLCSCAAAFLALYAGVESAWLQIVLGLGLGIWTIAGFRRVPTGYVGVPLIFGARSDSWVLSEGIQWLPAGVMGHIDVDIRIKSTTVPSVQAITKDGVPLRPTAVMSYRVAAPALYLGAGTNVENTGLPEVVGRSIIGFIKGRSCDEALSTQGNDLRSVRMTVGNAITKWGLLVDSIQMTNIAPPPEVLADMMKKVQMGGSSSRRN